MIFDVQLAISEHVCAQLIISPDSVANFLLSDKEEKMNWTQETFSVIFFLSLFLFPALFPPPFLPLCHPHEIEPRERDQTNITRGVILEGGKGQIMSDQPSRNGSRVLRAREQDWLYHAGRWRKEGSNFGSFGGSLGGPGKLKNLKASATATNFEPSVVKIQ